MTTDLYGERLLALRNLMGITQEEMASDLGVSGAFLSQLSKGRKSFPTDLAAAAAKTYRVPLSFFSVRLEPPDLGPVTFSRTSKARVRDENRVVQLYTEAARLFRSVSAATGYQEVELPLPAEHDGSPESLAQAVREQAGLGPEEPVRNVTRMFERLGVGVVHELDPSADDDGQHSGVSRPNRFASRPLIAVASSQMEPAKKRFTLAHELHHVIADRDLQEAIKLRRDAREKRADHFARALLLPATAAQSRIGETLSLQGYLRIKADYGISVGALIKRGSELRLVSERRAKSLYVQWSSHGWRTNEPVPVADERPLLLGQALHRVYGPRFAARASHVEGVAAELISRWVGPVKDEGGDAMAEVIDLSKRRR